MRKILMFCVVLLTAIVVSATTAPQVIAIFPSEGVEVGLNAPVLISFDQPMDQNTVENSIRIEPEAIMTFNWLDSQTLQLMPQTQWERITTYTITISTDAHAATGDAFEEPYTFQFQTAGLLRVIAVTPEDGNRLVNVNQSQISVAFDRPVVPLVANADQSDLPVPIIVEPAIDGSGQWLTTSLYIITVVGSLDSSTEYTITVPAGLTAIDGSVMEQDFIWQFRTLAPQVTGINPTDQFVNGQLLLDSGFYVEFSQSMEHQAAQNALSVQIDGESVPGRFEWRNDDKRMYFYPEELLPNNVELDIFLDNSAQTEDGFGVLESPIELTFTTVDLPQIVSVIPDQEVVPTGYVSVVFTFNTAINNETLRDNYTIEPELGNEVIAFFDEDLKNSFTLEFYAEDGVTYTITLKAGVEDIYGNAIQEDYVHEFEAQRVMDNFNLYSEIANVRYNFSIANIESGDPLLDIYGRSDTILRIYDAPFEQIPPFYLYRHRYSYQSDLYHYYDSSVYEYYARRPEYSNEDNLLHEWVADNISTEYLLPLHLTLADDEPLPFGVYGIEIENPGRDELDGFLLAVANVGITIKRGAKDTIIWATDLSTSAPVEGLTVTAYQNEDYILLGTTDSEGVVTIAEDALTNGLTFVTAEGEGRFGAWYGGTSERAIGVSRGYMYTDRPIYRPGETVYFRGVLRDRDDVTYTPPQNTDAPVEISAGEYRYYYYYDDTYEEPPTWYTTETDLNEYGTFSGSFEIPLDAQLGMGRVMATMCGDEDCTWKHVASISFEVAEFRVPEFEVNVTAQQSEVISSEPLNALVNARYYFGAPVNNARMSWNVYSSPTYFRYQGSERGYRFSPYMSTSYPRLSTSEISTDDSGLYLIDTDLLKSTDGRPYNVTIESTVHDSSGQAITGRTSVLLHPANVYLGVRPTPNFGLATEPFNLEFITVYPDSTPHPNRDITLNITEIRWVRNEESFGVYRWVREEIDLGDFEVTTDENGYATFEFDAPNPGNYSIQASTADDEGRMSYTSTYLYAREAVSRPGQTGWDAYEYNYNCSYSPEYRRLRVSVDETSYVPGETAQVFIPNPFDVAVQALVTVERAGVMFYDSFVIEGDSAIYPVDIVDEYAPTAYVGVTILTIPTQDQPIQAVVRGTATLNVEPVFRRLNISLSASEGLVAPGDEVWFDVQITDWQGEPVQGEVGLALVDEAVLALRPDNSSTMESAFYSSQSLMVDTYISNWALLEGADNTYESGGCGGGGGGGDGMGAEIPVRDDFQFTPLWAPHVVTDENGFAQVSVEMPDNLTRWELDARAVTMTTEVGQSEINITSSLPLIVRPAAPRFFVAGDKMLFVAVVNNLTGEDQTVDVTLQAVGLQIADDITQTVQIRNNDRARVIWAITVEDVDGVDITVIADAGEYGDAAKPMLTNEDGLIPVYRFIARDTVATSGVIDEASAIVEAISLPSRYSDVDGTLSVQLDASLADVTLNSLDYVRNYPHQCIEQTVSRFMPNAVTLTALTEFGLSNPELESNLTEALDFAIDKLKQDQNSDGGWGWFSRMNSNSNVTAYAILGLLEAQNAGYPVDADMIDNAVVYLQAALAEDINFNTPDWMFNRQAFIAYVLARGGYNPRETLDALFEQRVQMSIAGRIYMLMTYNILAPDDPAVTTLVDDLLGSVIVSASGAHWEEPSRDWWNWGSDTRTTALALSALVDARPDNPLLPNVVRWLVTARRGDHWETTQETTWAVIALTDWMTASGELNADYAYNVLLNTESIGQGEMRSPSDDALLMVSVQDMLMDTLNYLTITRTEGEGSLYYNSTLNLELPADEVDAFSNGITVDRTYSHYYSSRSTPITIMGMNETINVRISFTLTEDVYYFVLEDVLPAGMEIIDTNLLTETNAVSGANVRRYYSRDPYWSWANWYFDRIELRDTGANIYAEFLPKGTYIFTYQARTTIPGEYQVIPTQAYAFYQPELYGRSEGIKFIIEDAMGG